MDHLAHGGAGDGHAVFAAGNKTFAKGADGWVILPSVKDRHVKGLAQARVAGFRKGGLAFPLAGLLQLRGEASKGGGLFGIGEPVMRA